MLGPGDIADWDGDEADLLRAEIRLAPAVRRMASDPQAACAELGEALAARIGSFRRDGRLPVQELRRLLEDLRAGRPSS